MNNFKWVQNPKNEKTLSLNEEKIFSSFKDGREDSKNYSIKGFKKLLELITHTIKILIIGDYDADGIGSVTILMKILEVLSKTYDFEYSFIIPGRFTNGYGSTPELIREHCKKTTEPSLIIMIDNGIVAFEAVETAKELGWNVAILDHHKAKKEDDEIIKPNADLIIDPSALSGTAHFSAYCGAGLAYKFAQYLAKNGFDKIEAMLPTLSGIASISTIGDLVNLIEQDAEGNYLYDNYLIVRDGLKALSNNDSRTAGTYKLLFAMGKDEGIDEGFVGFNIVPALNALERMENKAAKEGVKLLLMDNSQLRDADYLAQKLKENNELRKLKTEEAMKIIDKDIMENHKEDDFPLICSIDSSEVGEGLLGLIAGKLCERHNTIAFAFARDEDFHGSGRCPDGLDLKNILDQCSDLIDKYGGHEGAAGLTISLEHMEEFQKRIKEIVGEKPDSLYNRYYDYEINDSDIRETLEIQDKYAPYGTGHPQPIYRIHYHTIYNKYGKNHTVMGKAQNMLKLNGVCDAVEFSGLGLKKFYEFGLPENMVIYGKLNWNTYNGYTNPQIQIIDIELEK